MKAVRPTMDRYPRLPARRTLAFTILLAMVCPACSRPARVIQVDSSSFAPMRSQSPNPIVAANAPANPMDPQPPLAIGTVLRIIPDGPEAADAEIRYAWASIEWHGRNEMFWLPLNGAETTVQLQKTVPTSELLTIRFSIPDRQSEVGRFVQGEWATWNLSSYDKCGEQTEVHVSMKRFRRIDVGANRLRPSF